MIDREPIPAQEITQKDLGPIEGWVGTHGREETERAGLNAKQLSEQYASLVEGVPVMNMIDMGGKFAGVVTSPPQDLKLLPADGGDYSCLDFNMGVNRLTPKGAREQR